MVDFNDAILAPDPTRRDAITSGWRQLCATGVVLTASQRRLAIAAARAAWAGIGAPQEADTTRALIVEAAHWVAVDAGGLTAHTVADLESRGLDRLAYLEVVGIVARLSNIDFYLAGIGASLPPLSGQPASDEPSRAVAPDSVVDRMWVPRAGPVSAPFVLDALPAEGEALRALHEPMYMPFHEMGDAAYADTLTRPQIEFVAARVSYLNECFY